MEISRSGGSLTAAFLDVGTVAAKALTVAMAGAAEGAKQDLRAQFRTLPRGQRAANSIRSAVYPTPPRYSGRAAFTIFAGGDHADRMLSALTEGPVITPRHARALAIPIHNFRGGNGDLLGPTSSFFRGRLKFIPARQRNGLQDGVLAIPATGRPGERRKARGAKVRAEVSRHVDEKWLPVFVLVRQVKMPRVLTPDAIMNKWADALPNLINGATETLGMA
jgi:hypothetical protein